VFFSSLAKRDRIPELMDDPGLDPEEHRRALAGLARLNAWSGSVGVLWKPLRALNRPLRVLDVATGSGDVPCGLMKRANAAGVPLEVAGCDVSPTAIEAAKMAAPGIHFFVHDAIRDPLPTGFDVVTCSLFLHHLDDESAIILLKRMAEAAGSCVLVNDLARSRFNYLSVWLACHALTRSRVVRFDGPASVRSAYSPAEALGLAERAGLKNARIRTRFPCRYLLEWRKHG
jgi:SAM-dependent methyltransferase